jgi:hypothetical protein
VIDLFEEDTQAESSREAIYSIVAFHITRLPLLKPPFNSFFSPPCGSSIVNHRFCKKRMAGSCNHPAAVIGRLPCISEAQGLGLTLTKSRLPKFSAAEVACARSKGDHLFEQSRDVTAYQILQLLTFNICFLSETVVCQAVMWAACQIQSGLEMGGFAS